MPLTPDQKEAARFLIRRYCERAEDTRSTKHYSQNRPMNHLGRSPSSPWTADCSGYVTGAFRWADLQLKASIDDPNGLHYNGFGFTGTLLANNRKGRVPLDHKFYIGDMALFGPSLSNTTHVILCRRNGKSMTALWSSHGSELGPYPVYLSYRPDLLCVVRAEDLR
jgi:cell wall-associated NlpC family hydrolase